MDLSEVNVHKSPVKLVLPKHLHSIVSHLTVYIIIEVE